MSVLLDVVAIVLAVLGTAFALLAAVGVVRLPDLYTRMQAASKGSTLGAICLLLAAACHFGDAAIAIRCIVVATFLAMTTPIAAHLLARAGYLAGVPLEEGHVTDQLAGHYEVDRRKLLHDDDDGLTHDDGREPAESRE